MNKIIISCDPGDVRRIKNAVIKYGQEEASSEVPLGPLSITLTDDDEINRAMERFYKNAEGDIDISKELGKTKPDESLQARHITEVADSMDRNRMSREEEEYDYDLSLQRKIATMDERQNRLMEMVGGLREFRQHTDTVLGTMKESTDRRLRLLEQFVVQVKDANTPSKVLGAPGSEDIRFALDEQESWSSDHQRRIEEMEKRMKDLETGTANGGATDDMFAEDRMRINDIEKETSRTLRYHEAEQKRINEIFNAIRKGNHTLRHRINDLEENARDIGVERILNDLKRPPERHRAIDPLAVRIGQLDEVIRSLANRTKGIEKDLDGLHNEPKRIEEMEVRMSCMEQARVGDGVTSYIELAEQVLKIELQVANIKGGEGAKGLDYGNMEGALIRLAAVEKKAEKIMIELHPNDPGRPSGVITDLYALIRTNHGNLSREFDGHDHTEFKEIHERMRLHVEELDVAMEKIDDIRKGMGKLPIDLAEVQGMQDEVIKGMKITDDALELGIDRIEGRLNGLLIANDDLANRVVKIEKKKK